MKVLFWVIEIFLVLVFMSSFINALDTKKRTVGSLRSTDVLIGVIVFILILVTAQTLGGYSLW